VATYLALDQSTSASKALLFDEDAALLASASLEHKQHYPEPGWVEHDLDEIWSNTLSVCREVASRAAPAPVALAVTNQRETVAFWDRSSGKPLRRALVWQDRRGVPLCQSLNDNGHGPSVQAKTGLPIDGYFSASKIAWAMENDAAVQQAARSGHLCIGTIDAYLIHRLTRGEVFATDSTNASRTLLMDLERRAWDEELLALFNAPANALPEIRSSFEDFGETDFEGLLEKPIPIRGVMGDSHASLLAHGGTRPGDAKATFGTGTSVMLNLGQQRPETNSEQPVALAWSFQGENTYAYEGLINYSAATIQWLRDQLGLIKDASESGSIAAELDSNEGVYLVPAFSGINLPVSAPEARATIVGLTARADKRHLIRASLESIAYQVDDCLTRFREISGVSIQALHGDGGPTQNHWLMQFCADILGITIKADDFSDFSPRGALFASWIASGKLGSPDAIRDLPRSVEVHTAKMPRQEAEANKAGWAKALRQTLAD